MPSKKNKKAGPVTHGDFVREGRMRGVAVKVNLGKGGHIPCRYDSLYINPDTMKRCGVAVAQLLLLQDIITQDVMFGKAWPLKTLQPDAVGFNKLPLTAGSAVMINVPPHDTTYSTIHTLTLKPLSVLTFPLNEAFKSYLLSQYESVVVSSGNMITLAFYGQDVSFAIESIVVANQPNQLGPTVTDTSIGISNLSLSDETRNSILSLDNSFAPSPSPPSLSSTPRPILPHNDSTTDVPASHDTSVTSHDINDLSHDLGNPLKLLESKGCVIGRISMTTNVMFAREKETPSYVLPRLIDVGGVKKDVNNLIEVLKLGASNELHSQDMSLLHRGYLLHGLPGTGKTLLASAIAGEIPHLHCTIVRSPELLMGSDPPNTLRQYFTTAVSNAPAIIIIDEVDLLIPTTEGLLEEGVRQTKAALYQCFMELRHQLVYVLGTTSKLDSIDTAFRRVGFFDQEIEIPAPSWKDREEILKILLRDFRHSLCEYEIVGVASVAHGYVGADLKALCQEALKKALLSSNMERKEGERVCISHGDMKLAMRTITPTAMKEVTVEVSKVYWTDIGGLDAIRPILQEVVFWPLTKPKALAHFGITPSRGVLLYGPPGCSKTMIAQAIATESGLNFISVKGPELFSKYVGDSEKAVRQIFSRARAASPAIIFFDEIDALASHSQGESSIGDKVIAQLLTELDGIERLDNVIIVAATNRPNVIAKALLRPGRIGRSIYVPLPNEKTRREIFEVRKALYGQHDMVTMIRFKKTPMDADVQVEVLARQTENFSGAEVVDLVNKAACVAVHDDAQCVSMKHFDAVLQDYSPQTDSSTIAYYEEFSRKTFD